MLHKFLLKLKSNLLILGIIGGFALVFISSSPVKSVEPCLAAIGTYQWGMVSYYGTAHCWQYKTEDIGCHIWKWYDLGPETLCEIGQGTCWEIRCRTWDPYCVLIAEAIPIEEIQP